MNVQSSKIKQCQQVHDEDIHLQHRCVHLETISSIKYYGSAIYTRSDKQWPTCLRIWLPPNPRSGTVQSVGKNTCLSSCKDNAWRATSILAGRLVSLMCKASMVLNTDPTVSQTQTHLFNRWRGKICDMKCMMRSQKLYSPDSGGPCNRRRFPVDEVFPQIKKPAEAFGFQNPNFILQGLNKTFVRLHAQTCYAQ